MRSKRRVLKHERNPSRPAETAERVLQGLEILENQERGDKRSLRLVEDYSMPNVAEKVARIILSYTDYVNRVVWKKY